MVVAYRPTINHRDLTVGALGCLEVLNKARCDNWTRGYRMTPIWVEMLRKAERKMTNQLASPCTTDGLLTKFRLIAGLTAANFTYKEISDFFGWPKRSINDWKQAHPETWRRCQTEIIDKIYVDHLKTRVRVMEKLIVSSELCLEICDAAARGDEWNGKAVSPLQERAAQGIIRRMNDMVKLEADFNKDKEKKGETEGVEEVVDDPFDDLGVTVEAVIPS